MTVPHPRNKQENASQIGERLHLRLKCNWCVLQHHSGGSPNSVLPLNAMLKHELLPLIRHILTAFVIPERFESLPSLLSAQDLYCLKASKASLFFLRSQQRRNREASSVKEIQYLYPFTVAGSGPCKSECTSSKGTDRREAVRGNESRVCFPSKQAEQIGIELAGGTLGST